MRWPRSLLNAMQDKGLLRKDGERGDAERVSSLKELNIERQDASVWQRADDDADYEEDDDGDGVLWDAEIPWSDDEE